MPPLIVAFAAWAGVSVAAAYLIAATVVLSAGMAVYGSAQARRAERKARDDLNASMKDRMVTRIATESPHRYIYGRAKVGADIVAMFTTGDRDQFKHLVCVHAAHECDGIEEIYVNNVAVGLLGTSGDATEGRFATDPGTEIAEESRTGPTFNLNKIPSGGQVWVFSGSGATMQPVAILSQSGRTITVDYNGPVKVEYAYAVHRRFDETPAEGAAAKTPVVRVQKHLGTPTDPVDFYLNALLPDKWPATAVLRGLCYTVITLDLNHPEFQGGLVPIHALIRGRKLYDPRTGLTAWSQNPALAIYDYLTSRLCGVSATDLPIAQFIAAANVCDENIAGLGARYTLNGTVTSDQSQSTVLEAMAQSMAGSLVSTTWDIYAGKYIAPVAVLTQEDIVGGLSVTPGVSNASVYNGVKGQYIGPENKYVQTDFKPYQNSVYRESDGRDLYTNIDFPFTETVQRVTNLARIFTEAQRNGFTIKAEFSLKAWPRKVGERITFTSATLGQTAKVYIITDKSYSPNSAVQLTLKEDAASIWDFADAVVVDQTPNSDLPDPWQVNSLASIACTSGEATLLRQSDGSMVPRILASWPADPARQLGTQIEVEWRAISSPTWNRATVSGEDTQAYLSSITPGYFYVVRARRYNPYLNVGSYWIMTTYQVQVFTARPVAYKWAADQPASPNEAGSYAWPTGTYSAPSGWSLTQPAAPTGGNVTLWEISPLVTDISATGSTPFSWNVDAVSVGYSPNAAGTGPAGYSNARVFAYQRKATAPTGTPGAVDVDLTTGTITTATLANGWLKTIPAADGNPLHITGASASGTGATDTIATGEWSGAVVFAYDGGAGTPGLNNATVALYKRTASATAPAKPTATMTFTFASGALTGVDNGWTQYIPSTGGAYLHTTFGTAIGSGATDTIAPSELAAVQLMYDATDLIAAKAAADSSLAAIDAMRADDKLDPSEKPAENIRWNAVVGEQPTFDGQAAALGITTERTAYGTAFTALQTYINNLAGFTAIPGSAITIVGATYRAKFNDYYTAREALRSAIATKSATAPSLVIGGANLIPDGDFERSTRTFATRVGISALVDQGSPAGTYSGSKALFFDGTATDMYVYLGDQVLVTPGQSYGVSFQHKTAGSVTQGSTFLRRSDGVHDELAIGNLNAGTWSRHEQVWVCPAGVTWVEFRAGIKTNGGYSWMGVDEIKIEKGNKVTAFTRAQADIDAGIAAAALTAAWAGVGGTGRPQDNATVGAPAGTQVAGVDAATLAAQAAAGASANAAITSAFDASGLYDFTQTGYQNGIWANYVAYTAAGTGGTAPYTYAWTLSNYIGTLRLNTYSGPTVTVQGMATNSATTASVMCTVTDANGRTKVLTCWVECAHGTGQAT